jgi:16S rRNA (cytidine1402-2'-O)-methyltransferase
MSVGTASARAGGTLHLVPVPLDPDADASAALDVLAPGALAVLRATDYFLVENAKTARAWLRSLGHPVALRELKIVEIGHAPDPIRLVDWLAPVQAGRDAVVLSEAGCPGIADPGALLAAAAHARGLRVRPWTGPSSILLALMASGLNGQCFRFLGYLPREADALATALPALAQRAAGGETQIFIETPYRNTRLLGAILTHCPPATVLCVAADLTAPSERILRRSIAAWRDAHPELQRVQALPQPSPQSSRQASPPHVALEWLERHPAVFLLGAA